MDVYRSLAVFVAVAESGSFSAAGRRLKLSTSVVSHHVSKLEARYGAPLLFRSTRSLSLTAEGRAVLPSARAMVDAAEEALDTLSDTSRAPSGTLRVTFPAFGERSPLQTLLMQFARDHPLVTMSVHTSEFPVDLVRDGYDVAIRLGVLSDSALKSRRIGSFGRKLVASPAFLGSQPPIRSIEDLQRCPYISMAMLPDRITLIRGGEEASIVPDTIRMEVHSVSSAKSAVLEGLGLRDLPGSAVSEEIAAGTLAQILPDWSLPDLGVYAVWPDAGPQKKLTRRLIDYLADHANRD